MREGNHSTDYYYHKTSHYREPGHLIAVTPFFSSNLYGGFDWVVTLSTDRTPFPAKQLVFGVGGY